MNAANKEHTQVKEKDDCSGSFTIATEHYQSNEQLQAPTSRSLPSKNLFHSCSE
ncbi:MAG: hypothetical protein AAF915_24960 [Cyanobacteria bacterium P01_D01_bin.50]